MATVSTEGRAGLDENSANSQWEGMGTYAERGHCQRQATSQSIAYWIVHISISVDGEGETGKAVRFQVRVA